MGLLHEVSGMPSRTLGVATALGIRAAFDLSFQQAKGLTGGTWWVQRNQCPFQRAHAGIQQTAQVGSGQVSSAFVIASLFFVMITCIGDINVNVVDCSGVSHRQFS